MRPVDTSDLWWKNAVIYCVDVSKFLDDDGDGTGDLPGVSRRIDYLAELGVSCLWLMPIYVSPRRDNGYDVADFYGIDSKFGNHGDLVELIRTAADRGIRVILDLVVNHTSDQHPWFQSARRGRNARYRDFYIWRDEPPADTRDTMVPGAETSVWEWDERTDQYFMHSFFSHQPDLNVDNPKVIEELTKVMGFWLELGVSGFRLDAVPSLVSAPTQDQPDRDHSLLRVLRSQAQRRSSTAVLLGEVNLPYDEQEGYFGERGDEELHMQFDFPANQALYLALARCDATPLREALSKRPEVSVHAQCANFVRNHDELNLDQLTEDEREEVFAKFAPNEDQRVFGRGIRRRLPSMLGGDPRWIRMVYSLLFSLPGTPVLLYGEEIGLTENLDEPGRHAVRTPMQWSSDENNAGFSQARPSRFVAPINGGPWGPRHVNAEDQLTDPDSLLTFISQLARSYRQSPEIGWGELELLDCDAPAVLAHSCANELGRFIAMHNFSEVAVTTEITINGEPDGAELIDLTDGTHLELRNAAIRIDIEPFGALRYRVRRPGEGRIR